MNQGNKDNFICRLFPRRWLRYSLFFIYVAIWIITGFWKILQEKSGFELSIDAGLKTAVMRAIFMKEDEYQIVPTEDKWFQLVHKYDEDRAFPYFCQVRPGGQMFAILPNGHEAPAMIQNCTFIISASREEFSPVRQWFKNYLTPLEAVFSFVFQPLIWDMRWVHYVYLPAEYLDHKELYFKIMDALQLPCKYSYQGQNSKNNSYDTNTYDLCSRHDHVEIKIHILKPGTIKYSKDMEYQEIFNITAKQ